jgi:hypothetical protein
MNILLKRFVFGFTALTTIILPTATHAVFVDLSGIRVDGGDPTVITVEEDEFLEDPFDIFYSFNIRHFRPSWGEETEISLFNFAIEDPADGTIEISGSADCGFGDRSGLFSCTGRVTVLDPFIFPEDEWIITLSDSYNDRGQRPDYRFLAGSYLAWGDDAPSSNVPEPSPLLLMGSVIFGLGLSRMSKTKA